MSDPLRLTIFKAFHHLNRPATAKQIADALTLAPAKVHYHVQKLLSIGILELDHTEEINGIIAKFYKTSVDSFVIDYSNISDKVRSSVYSKSENLYISTFNAYRDTFIDNIRKKVEKQQPTTSENRSGFLIHNALKLEQKDYEKFYGEMTELVEKYMERSCTEGVCSTYQFLCSAIREE
ncbi:helix-turn-helix domain-containing protein [Acidaminobacter sp.]|uniref:helix-turn-helix domain-containing protein n=1 Tax=Acidaminobacter sp. TaxID=1872102 RepID=UPI00255D5144|nr:helix-turn-helix domain-containing protein [Acidaminobacter sp.]MDK9711007.1 helix-turn-helix domain-containing protein [Acidaminobacter sp.]